MTVKGIIFKGYAEVISARHGFGSRKMVREYDNKRMMGLLRESDSMDTDREIGEAHRWLLDNGYIRDFSYVHRMSTRVVRYGERKFIGLTEKGWAVAEKYLNN